MHSALGALFWGSYVRARLVLSSDVRTDVRACVTAYVRVYGLSGDAGIFLEKKPELARLWHIKFVKVRTKNKFVQN